MTSAQLLHILQTAEKLKCTTRHCSTSSGRRESVAEHSWQMTLMALLLEQEFLREFPGVDMHRVLRMCLIHDLGEAFTGDIPAFVKSSRDAETEDSLLLEWVGTFPEPERAQWLALYREMNALETTEAKIYKAMDKLEAVIQHDLSDISTWLPLEYDLQLSYGREEVQFSACTQKLKTAVDAMTLEKIQREGKA